MKPFTVVLLRPDYLADPHYGEDYYVAHVDATDPDHAMIVAQEQVFEADVEDGQEPVDYADYGVLVVFAGTQKVLRFGWQI